MKLYSYWRSSTSYRVRAALNLKGLDYEIVSVDLLAGAQKSAEYKALNPGAGVPTLILDDGTSLPQSLAIIEFLDAGWPDPPLLPTDPFERAQVQAAAHIVALDIHPVNNTRLIGELKSRFDASQPDCEAWMRHWMALGFEALEAMLPESGTFAFGDQPNLADLCIVAQIYNARRWGLDLTPYAKIRSIETACLATPAIFHAHPDQQIEAKTAS